MTLANKYLRYSPEITLEIFTLIWNKLESLFPNGKIYDWVKVWDFDTFKERGYISIWGNNKYCFGINCCPGLGNYTEATVQEILGYDPFVNKEVIPEYVECIKVATKNTKIGEIFKCRHSSGFFEWEYNDKSGISYNSWDGWSGVWKDELPQKYFKPSTKEAFDAQNNPKSIEKWSVGSYFVIENDGLYNINSSKRGDICLIKENGSFNFINKKDTTNWSFDLREGSSWFATKSEAEEFAKTLVEPVKKEIKQPLKQAVHCKTQEEWDFVTEKLGYKWSKYSEWNYYENNTCIGLNKLGFGTAGVGYKEYQILSFQEWCDLNGYKMEKEVKFEIGKWYRVTDGKCKAIGNNRWYAKSPTLIDNIIKAKEYLYENSICKFGNFGEIGTYTFTEVSLEEIQQYLPDNHPDKIKVDREFKIGDWVYFMGSGKSIVNTLWQPGKILQIKCIIRDSLTFHGCSNYTEGFRHATPEEVNNHLISIGQIPAGEPLNTGIEPDKNSVLKYDIICGSSWSGCTTQNHSKALILKNEIIKPAIEFNYLPEPK